MNVYIVFDESGNVAQVCDSPQKARELFRSFITDTIKELSKEPQFYLNKLKIYQQYLKHIDITPDSALDFYQVTNVGGIELWEVK